MTTQFCFPTLDVFVGGLACALLVSARADVVTNTWITPAGGYWYAQDEAGVFTNWYGNVTNAADLTSGVGVFALEDQAWVCTSSTAWDVRPGGLVFRPHVDGTAEPPAAAASPTWYLWSASGGAYWQHARCSFDASEGTVFPLRVEDGSLVLSSAWNARRSSVHDGAIRKEGNGALRVSNLYYWNDAGRVLEIAEGSVIPMVAPGLAYMDVRVTDPAGSLTLTNYSATTLLGALTAFPGSQIPLAGANLTFGAMDASVLPGEVTGTGRVTAVVRSLYVTNVQPDIVYGARGGRLRLDTRDAAAVPFAKYDFETSLTADSSGHGRNLTQEGSTVERIYDEERGGYVARFTVTDAGGTAFTAVDPDTDELTGDTDYTISLWAKAASPCSNNWPTFVSMGVSQFDHSLVQFRFVDGSCQKLLLGHWNTRGDKSDRSPVLPGATWNPAVWHHYVARREAGTLDVWVDGTNVCHETLTGLEMALAKPATVMIGGLVGAPTRRFHGDLDDVRIYSQALGAGAVERLFKGLEPVQNGALPAAAGTELDIPSGTKLALELNGHIQLAGHPVLSATNVTASSPRGALDLPAGGTLTLEGPGEYPARVTGAGKFVKAGPGRLALSGRLEQRGGTEVKSGTLALLNIATYPRVFARYGFESGLGADDSGNGRDLKPGPGVARVWDADRGGYVLRLPGIADQMTATVTTSDFSGNTDYTISVWAKPAADCPDSGGFVSLGQQESFKEVVFRYQAAVSSGMLVLSHWGGALDFIGIPSSADPAGAWHHYAATRRGNTYTVYCDGTQIWTTTGNTALQIPAQKIIALGAQLGNGTRNFKGDLDDVRIYAQAFDEANLARIRDGLEPLALPSGAVPEETAASIPAPVLHYAFEDTAKPGRDSAPGACHLEKKGAGNFSFIASPLGGKALKFDTYAQVYLKSAGFPAALPPSGRPFTVSFWAQTAKSDWRTTYTIPGGGVNWHTPTFVSWGDPQAGTIGYMLSFWHDGNAAYGNTSARCYIRKSNGSACDVNFGVDFFGLLAPEPELRWHHYATVYDPQGGVLNYIDGEYLAGSSAPDARFFNDMTTTGHFYLGAKSTAESTEFHGALDEVKVYAAALTDAQIRAVMDADLGRPHVLPDGGAVMVDAGATLDVDGTDESVGSLSGAGELVLTSGRLAVSGTNTFDGALSGAGILRLPAGAALTLTQAPSAFAGYVELAGGALALPAGTDRIPATFRVTPIDTAAPTACAGDVEIPDGTALSVTKEQTGPFVTAAGRVIVKGGGTVALPTSCTSGAWTIARGAEDVRDDGAGELSARWTVSNLGPDSKARFLIQGGDFICRVYGGGLVIMIR